MKMNIFAVSFVAFACAMGAFAGTVTEITDDMTAQGDWEVTVAAGDSNVVAVAQSGGGKIVKKGGGWLVLRKNSTFTGGVELQEGFVMVDPDADAGTAGTVSCTALGTGDVTILGQRSGYTGYCELGIVGAGSNDTRIVTVANNINVTGTSDGTYPALVIYGQNSVLTGKITAAADFYFWDDFNSATAIYKSQYNRYLFVQSCTLGEIEAVGTIGYAGWCRFVLAGKVKTPKFDMSITRARRSYDGDTTVGNNNAHGAFVFNVPCEIGELIDNHRFLYCAAANVLPGTLFRHTIEATGITGSVLGMNDGYNSSTYYDQTLGGLVSSPLGHTVKWGSSEYEWTVDGGSSKTLTITGIAPEAGETERELVTCAWLRGAMNLTIDAYDGFTQTFSNRTHTISKTIRAKKGGFRAAGLVTFPNLTGITVDQGARFDFFTATSNAVAKLASLTVNGTFTMSAAAAASGALDTGTPITPRLNLSIGANGSLSLPQGTTLNVWQLSVDGVAQPVGTYTHADLPQLSEGATIIVRSTAQSATGVWTGAAESDNLMATMANWQGSPESLSFGNYTLGVTITNSGTEMVYADGTKINNINFTRTQAAEPFTIRPATPGASLEVVGRINLKNSAQLILKDVTLATPNHTDQGPSGDNNTTMFMTLSSGRTTEIQPYIASNNVYLYKHGDNLQYTHLPFILDNAIIEKPVYIKAGFTPYEPFHCVQGTTNEFKGAFGTEWQGYLIVEPDTQITFSGGVSYGTFLHKDGTGTMIVKDKPITATSYFLHHAGLLALDAENFSLRGSNSGEGMSLQPTSSTGLTLDCRRSYCFNGDCALLFWDSSNKAVAEFNSTTQRVTRLNGRNPNASSKMQGAPGSLLEVVGGWGKGRTKWDDKLDIKFKLLTNRVDIAGALSLKMSATNETMTFYSKAFSTCGDLEVSAGTLEFRSNATWLNGTNVAVNGEGRLKIGKSGTFSGKFAELALADGGVFEIPSGQSQTFNYVTTNGVQVSSGRHASLPNGDGDFLAGGGEIVVRRKGIVFSVR